MMHHLKQRRWLLMLQFLLATMIALTILIGQSQASQAASFTAQASGQVCQDPGRLVQSIPVTANGSIIAELDIYYNLATHYNCAYLRDRGPAWGAASHIDVTIERCAASVTQGNTCYMNGAQQNSAADSGTYKYYAGPAGINGEGRCIYVEGSLVWKGKTYETSTGGASHCG